ncbi:MAG TPA: ATP-binding protein [Thermoanaerobaculaceae bacterium]|nr:ATP-binding protein [Thermoanaerobaculaceae bacterium]
MSRRSTPGFVVGLCAFAAVLAGSTLTDWFRRAAVRDREIARLVVVAEALAPRAAALLGLSSEEADAEIRRWAATSGLRVTLIGADGRVQADTWTLPSLLGRLENHLDRPEVVAARRDNVGIAHRRSVTIDRPLVYVARLLGPAERPVGFLRLAWEGESAGLPWLGAMLALAVGALAGGLTNVRARAYRRAVARHLAPWSELPADADLEAVAEEADRRFRAQRESLEREAEVARAALERIDEGIVLLDREGSVRFANPAAVKLLGAQLAVSRPLVEAARAPEMVAAVRAVLEGGGIQHTTVRAAGDAEAAVRVCAVSHPVLAAAVVLRDVREERQLERARRALVADLAHELRTPLTVLSGLTEELHEVGGHDELTATLQRQVVKLRAFAAELEELTRIESGQVLLNLGDADAAAVARQVVAEAHGAAVAAGVELRQVGGPAPLRTDPVRLAQVLANLVDNGIRYNRRGGHVTVRCSCDGGGVRLEVEDDGLGIPASEIGLVFQRFYRVRRQAEVEGGSGLGLAIVKHLVGALSGTVSLASREGQGTTVTLTFPLLPSAR